MIDLKKYLYTILFVLISGHTYARPYWQNNQASVKNEEASVIAAIDEIPLYAHRVDGSYDILAPVRGQDMLNQKKDAIFFQMRKMAYQVGADAVMGVKCKPIFKSVFQSCDGFAIKYKN